MEYSRSKGNDLATVFDFLHLTLFYCQITPYKNNQNSGMGKKTGIEIYSNFYARTIISYF